MSLSISRVLVLISSVLNEMMSSGMSSQVSSGGTSGVTSIAAGPSVFAAPEDAGVSGCFSLFDGGLLGGGAEDIAAEG